MPDALYERDFLVWSETQASLLRQLAAGQRPNETLDWARLSEEVEDLGRAELNACEALLLQAMLHLLKLHGFPDDRACNHWRAETAGFLIGARRRFTPSMRQRLRLGDIYQNAKRLLDLEYGGSARRPESCPFVLDDLLAEDTEFSRLLNWAEPEESTPC